MYYNIFNFPDKVPGGKKMRMKANNIFCIHSTPEFFLGRKASERDVILYAFLPKLSLQKWD